MVILLNHNIGVADEDKIEDGIMRLKTFPYSQFGADEPLKTGAIEIAIDNYSFLIRARSQVVIMRVL